MGGVKTCSTGCSKNDSDYEGFSQKRRNKKKMSNKLPIESNASMGYSNNDKFKDIGMNGEQTSGDFAFSNNTHNQSNSLHSNNNF